MSSRARHRGVRVAVTVIVGACARPAAKASQPAPACVEDERAWGPPSTLAIVAGPMTSEVAGVVIRRGDGTPLAGAKVWLDSMTANPVATAGDGRFFFPSVRPGRHVITMRRIGVRGLRDTIDVPLAGQLRIDAQEPPNDAGCDSFGEVLIAKPWWKIW